MNVTILSFTKILLQVFCRGVSQIACWSEANSNQWTEKFANIFAKTTFMEESNMQLASQNYNHSFNTGKLLFIFTRTMKRTMHFRC